jgi:hypothetical protein
MPIFVAQTEAKFAACWHIIYFKSLNRNFSMQGKAFKIQNKQEQ